MHASFSTQDYTKWLKEANRESLAQALRRLAQLNQAKIYLFWKVRCRGLFQATLKCRGPDLNPRQPGLQLHPQVPLSRVLSQSELPRHPINMKRMFIFKFSEILSYLGYTTSNRIPAKIRTPAIALASVIFSPRTRTARIIAISRLARSTGDT